MYARQAVSFNDTHDDRSGSHVINLHWTEAAVERTGYRLGETCRSHEGNAKGRGDGYKSMTIKLESKPAVNLLSVSNRTAVYRS